MSENINDLSSYGEGNGIDISLPDIPIPEIIAEDVKEI